MRASFGLSTQNSFSLMIGEGGRGFGVGLPDVDSAGSERMEAVDF